MYDTRFILRCPNAACGQHVRVPTNLGALTVTCPECRQRWDWDPRADFRWPSQPRRWWVTLCAAPKRKGRRALRHRPSLATAGSGPVPLRFHDENPG